MMPEELHPTAQQLIDTVSMMLDGQNPNDILIDDVLEKSGVSRGSLYHHFGDYSSLIEQTLIRRFSVNVDIDIKALAAVVKNATSKEDYWARMYKLNAVTQIPARASFRAERARIISLASSNERFGQLLAVEQERLTRSMAETIAAAQAQGWVTSAVSAQTIAVFLQAYAIGRAIDDIAETHIPQEEWLALIELVTSPLAQ